MKFRIRKSTLLFFLLWIFANGIFLGIKLSFDESIENAQRNLRSIESKLPSPLKERKLP